MDPTPFEDVAQSVSTGGLPGWRRVDELVRDAHARYATEKTGSVADDR